MDKYSAEQMLGLSGTYGYEEMKSAYRSKVLKCHPDVGGSDEAMTDLNSARDYLEALFANNPDARVACSADKRDFDERQPTYCDGGYAPWDEEIKRESEKHAPFTEHEYVIKPQDDWTQDDWEAFKAFRPPFSYTDRMLEGYLASMPLATGVVVEAGNIRVEDWSDKDWFFYWYKNTRTISNAEGHVYVRRPAIRWSGPYAERDLAKQSPNYLKTKERYSASQLDGWLKTPYGKVDEASNSGYDPLRRINWKTNVGIPFAYASSTDYQSWREMNLEAQCEAIRQNRKYRNCTPVAAKDGWTGLEFLDLADKDAEWIRKLHLHVPDLDETARAGDSDNAMPGLVRFIKRHAVFLEWVVVVATYFLFTFVVGPLVICGYSSFEEFENAMSAMTMGEQLVVGAKLWTMPVVVFFLRNRIGHGIVRLCDLTVKRRAS